MTMKITTGLELRIEAQFIVADLSGISERTLRFLEDSGHSECQDPLDPCLCSALYEVESTKQLIMDDSVSADIETQRIHSELQEILSFAERLGITYFRPA